MKRRQIKIRNATNYRDTLSATDSIKDKLRGMFHELSDDQINRFIGIMENGGINTTDLQYALEHNLNEHRPSIPVSTTRNEHVIDQLLLSQGMYTDFTDTPSKPNYALRHRAETETILRRISLGDTLLLQASNLVQMRGNPKPDHQDDDHYWELIYNELLGILQVGKAFRNRLTDNADTAALTSLQFALATSGLKKVTMGSLNAAFFDERSPFYTGVSVVNEQRRMPDSNNYVPAWEITDAQYGDESKWMTAVLVTLFTIDNHAEKCFENVSNAVTSNGSRPEHQLAYFITLYGVTQSADHDERYVRQDPVYDEGSTMEARTQNHLGQNVLPTGPDNPLDVRTTLRRSPLEHDEPTLDEAIDNMRNTDGNTDDD